MVPASTPVLKKFQAVKFSPIKNQAKRPSRKVAIDEFQSVNADGRLMIAILSMEVGRSVVLIKHSDNDSIENTDCGHSKTYLALFW